MSLTNSAKQSSYVFLGTLSSRILGFIRVILLATTLGFTRLSDSYSLANNTPNMMFELILGSVIASTMVPFFVAQLKKKDDQADAALITFATLTALVLTVITLLLSPLIAKLMTIMNNDSSAEAQSQLVLFFLLFFLPQIFFYALTAVMQAYLSARKRFVAAAFAPIANNVIVISTLLYLKTKTSDFQGPLNSLTSKNSIWILATATTLGVVAVTFIVSIAFLRAGGKLKFVSIRHPNVKLLLSRSKWMVAYAVANQISLFIVVTLANSTEGGVLMYTTAFLFSQLPHGLLAVTLMTTLIPRIAYSVEHPEEGYEEFKITQDTIEKSNSASTALFVLMSIVSSLLIAVAVPALVILTAYGQVSAEQSEKTAHVLIAFTAFLPMYSLYLFIVRLGNVFHKTKELFLINIAQNVLNVVLAIALLNIFGTLGLAIAFSVSYFLIIPFSLRLCKKVMNSSLLNKKIVSNAFIFCAIAALVGYMASSQISNTYLAVAFGAFVCLSIQLVGGILIKEDLKQLSKLAYSRSNSSRNVD